MIKGVLFADSVILAGCGNRLNTVCGDSRTRVSFYSRTMYWQGEKNCHVEYNGS